MKAAELRRWMKAQGCTFEECSRHTKVLLGDRFTFIPRHAAEEVKPGTLHGILKRLGLKK
jgi:predicted RNA binding protein YcfA (HicA-like mRNA interferase family)